MKSQERLSPRRLTILINKENKDLLTSSRQVLSMLDSGRVDSEMDMENKLGQMGLNISENGVKTELMAKADLSMSMVIFTKGSGQMIKQMAMEYTSMSTVLNTKESGKMIFNMVRVLKLGLMGHVTKVITLTEESTVLAPISGMMGLNTQETGKKIRSQG
jgi:hypothetical protein